MGGQIKALCSLQPACLHTGIIYHNTSRRASLLITRVFEGVVGSEIIRVDKNLNHVNGVNPDQRAGLGAAAEAAVTSKHLFGM